MMIKAGKRKPVITTLIGLLMLAVVAISSSRGRAEGGHAAPQKQGLPPTAGNPGKARSEEDVVRDAYARLMRYHTAALDEASASLGIAYKPQDYLTFVINIVRTGMIEEILDRPLSELVTPRGDEVINLRPNYL